MIKNKGLVSRMSLRQKIQLVTSTTLGKSCPVNNYEFPVFRFSFNPVADEEGIYATQFPCDKALACSWNLPLVKNVYKCLGNEAKANASYAYFNVSNSLLRENVSEDYYFASEFLASKARGVNMSGAPVNFEYAPDAVSPVVTRQAVKSFTDTILSASAPDALWTKNAVDAECVPETYRFKGITYGVAASKEDAARLFFLGCSLVFLKEDILEELYSYFEFLTGEYEKSATDFKEKKINLTEFDRRSRNLEILNAELIDSACDRIIDALMDMREGAASVDETPSTIDAGTHTAAFNEVLHDKMALAAAQQSMVLVKNDERVLPLREKTKVAVIGAYAKEPDYLPRVNRPTRVALPFDAINDYELEAVGYAHGYARGESKRVDLVETACELCAEAEIALVYLCAEAGERALPQGQLELLDALREKNVKIAAIVSAEDLIDFSFVEKCDAVLFTYRGGQESGYAALDIVTGAVAPSGRFTQTVPVSVDENYALGEIPAYLTTVKEKVRYPFGYGLSYTTFEYKNLRITESGVSCTVYNTGNCDGYAVVQLYVTKQEGSNAFVGGALRGFAKVLVKKNDAAKVEIAFDSQTFRCYDAENDRYVVEGGEYQIFLAENIDDVKLNGTLTLESFVYGEEEQAEVVAETYDGDVPVKFTESAADEEIRKQKKTLSFGAKLGIAIMLVIYCDLVGALLLFTNIVATKSIALYVVTGVLLVLFNALFAFYAVTIAKKRKLQRYMHPNDVLTDMVEKAAEFDEIAKVSYREPVQPEVSESEEAFVAEEPEPEPEEVEPEPVVMSYDSTFAESEEEISFTQQVSLAEICANFRAFAANRGITVEPVSARAVFSAIAASKMVVLNTLNRDVLPDFLAVLNEYFNNTDIFTASDDWKEPNDLLWKAEGDKFVISDFANAVYAASKTTDKNAIVILDNVNFENLRGYFADFIGNALYPSEERNLVLNEEVSLRLPENLCYVLVPSAEAAAEMPPELAHAAVQVEVVISKSAPQEEETEIKTVSFRDFGDLVREAREKCFLPERIWKKIDELTETIALSERFAIGNKNVLQIEKLSSVILESGGDESEAFQGVFTAKIVPLLKQLKSYKKEGGDKTVCGILEKLFADEEIGKIKRQMIRNA